ncbi:MAG: MaoC family dehydratase [Paracoccaceae bacterium]
MSETRLFEDFVVGEIWTSREEEITQEAIIAFAKSNDPQPIHTDPVAAAEGRFGTIIASGWQIAALSLRLFVESGGYGKTPNIGLGVDELRWTAVVRPGDKLHVVRELVEKRRSKSRPDRGILRTKVSVRNQDGKDVMTLVSLGQVPARTNGE